MLFLNDQNVKDTEKEGARSREGKSMAKGVEGASMKLTAVKNSVGKVDFCSALKSEEDFDPI